MKTNSFKDVAGDLWYEYVGNPGRYVMSREMAAEGATEDFPGRTVGYVETEYGPLTSFKRRTVGEPNAPAQPEGSYVTITMSKKSAKALHSLLFYHTAIGVLDEGGLRGVMNDLEIAGAVSNRHSDWEGTVTLDV